jgi:hypothetical protein
MTKGKKEACADQKDCLTCCREAEGETGSYSTSSFFFFFFFFFSFFFFFFSNLLRGRVKHGNQARGSLRWRYEAGLGISDAARARELNEQL